MVTFCGKLSLRDIESANGIPSGRKLGRRRSWFAPRTWRLRSGDGSTENQSALSSSANDDKASARHCLRVLRFTSYFGFTIQMRQEWRTPMQYALCGIVCVYETGCMYVNRTKTKALETSRLQNVCYKSCVSYENKCPEKVQRRTQTQNKATATISCDRRIYDSCACIHYPT